jgi:uroporphyrinogen-III synthase
VTRAADKAKPLVEQLTALGAKVQVIPVLEVRPTSDWDKVDQAIDRIEQFDWIVFASANAVNYFLGRTRELGALERLSSKIAALGPATAESLRQFQLTAQFIPSVFIADSFVAEMSHVTTLAKSQILWPRGNRGRMLIADKLTAAGAHVHVVSCYESGLPEDKEATAAACAELVKLHSADIITFASSESVKNFTELVALGSGENESGSATQILHQRLGQIVIAAIGSETAKACRRHLGKVDLQASEYTTDGIVQALLEYARHHI